MDWKSYYIFHTGDTIRIIQKAIIPIIDQLVNEDKVSTYFFILYNEGGNHIRLRLKSEMDPTYLNQVVNNLMSEYFAKYPSQIDPNRDVSFYKNDSIQMIPYEPEFARYGGIKGIEIAEQQFRNSSDAVLSYLSEIEVKDDNYNSLLNLAIKLHLASAFYYSEGRIENSILFFNNIFVNSVANYSYPLLSFNPTIEAPYSEYYKNQKNIIVPYVKAVWNSFLNDVIIDEPLEKWKINEANITKQLLNGYNSRNITVPFSFENFPIWSITQSYVHMTNNRLGIKPIDEPFIAYLLMKSLEEIDLLIESKEEI